MGGEGREGKEGKGRAMNRRGRDVREKKGRKCRVPPPTFHDTIRKKSLTWTQKLSDQLNLAHVARKKYEKEETKTNKCQCPQFFQ